MEVANKKEITDYFRTNIFEAFSAYNAWKMLAYSKFKGAVAEQMAERYLEVQKYHPEFFVTVERVFLVSYVITSLHSFDKRDDSFSLYKVNEIETTKFFKENIKVISALKNVRNKIFAHKDYPSSSIDYVLPSANDTDIFFINLIKFYNQLTSSIDNSLTMFSNAEEIKRGIELLFMNLYRGEAVRLKEIDIKYLWKLDSKKASDIL